MVEDWLKISSQNEDSGPHVNGVNNDNSLDRNCIYLVNNVIIIVSNLFFFIFENT